jgi:hypothetical protein
MTNIKEYMHDGANWQAQAVLACVRYGVNAYLYPDGEDKPVVLVGRFENCREQGYVLTLTLNESNEIMCYCVYEHRNSDSICVQMFHSSFMNTPSIDAVFYGKRDKWDIDQLFGCGKIDECATFIYEDMRARWKEFTKNKEELGWDAAVKILYAQRDKWYSDAKKRDEEYENGGK